MKARLWCLATAFVAALLLPSIDARAKSVPARARPPRVPERNIAIVVNGRRLPLEPAPRIVSGRLLVPVVRIFGALGIPVTRVRNELVAQTPGAPIHIVRGSRRAVVGRRPMLMQIPPVQLDGTTYVPLDLLTQTIGATAAYDGRANLVQIRSSLVRRDLPTEQTAGGEVRISGNLSAVDMLSHPESITVTYGQSVRTIPVVPSARILLEDVVARAQQRARLADLHVGDAVAVTIDRNGGVALVEDRYGSRIGTIAAVSSSALVLENGRVLSPERTTGIVLNGQLATLADLRVGDTVTQRMNPQTGETSEIVAVRQIPAAAHARTANAGPAIAAFTVDPSRPLRAGEHFTLTLDGTPGGRATYDLGNVLRGQPMREEEPGVYRAVLQVADGMNFTKVPVLGRLAYAGDIVTQQAAGAISASTIPPQITEIAPAGGQVVNNATPSIYATFDAPTELGVDPASVVLKVNGKDVSGLITRTSSFVTYSCNAPLADGPVTVSVSVGDYAGNETTRSWTFTIQTR